MASKPSGEKKRKQGVFRESFGKDSDDEQKSGTSLKNRIRSLKRLLAKPVCAFLSAIGACVVAGGMLPELAAVGLHRTCHAKLKRTKRGC